jgi:hypothetical protein
MASSAGRTRRCTPRKRSDASGHSSTYSFVAQFDEANRALIVEGLHKAGLKSQALAKLPDETSIDGELVALDETGRPSFNVLQNYRRAGSPLQFYAFDVLTLAGRSLQNEPLQERRKILRTKVIPRMPESVLFSETLEATASEVTKAVKAQGLEGVIPVLTALIDIHCIDAPVTEKLLKYIARRVRERNAADFQH